LARYWQSNYFLKNFATIWEVKRYGARYYDPALQRFISEDPIGFSSSDFNFYRYSWNSPTNFIDPYGYNTGTYAGAEIGFAFGGPIGAGIGAAIGTAVIWWGVPALWDWWNSPDDYVCNYEPAPDDITDLFPNAKREKSKNQRRRWRDSKNGDIYEWDYQHGDVEIYNKRGKHKGSQNPKSKKKKPPVPGRKTDK